MSEVGFIRWRESPGGTSGRPAGGRRGLTLAEMVVSMVLVSVMLVAALNVAGGVRRGENSSSLRRRAMVLAEDLMTEILEQDYADPNEDPNVLGLSETESTTGDRTLFNDVDDYDGWKSSPPENRDGTPLPGLDAWQRTASVVWVDPDDHSSIESSDTGAKRVTVKVNYNGDLIVELEAIRTAGLPPLEACCLGDLSCVMLREEACEAEDGTPQGEGSHCYSLDCKVCDDFEDYDLYFPPDSSWVVHGDASITVDEDDGNQVLWDGIGGGAPVIFAEVSVADVAVCQKFRSLYGNVDHAGLIARYVNDDNMVYGGIVQERRAQIWVCISGNWQNIGKNYNSSYDGNGAWSIPDVATIWHKQELRIVGDHVELYVDGALIGTATLPTGSPAAGYTGFWSQDNSEEGYRDEHCVRLAD